MKTIDNERKQWPTIASKKDAQKLCGHFQICPFCQKTTPHRSDNIRKEVFCEECGYVNRETYYHKILRLQHKYEKKTYNDKRTWRLNLYKRYVGVVGAEFMMTHQQKSNVAELIEKVGNLKKLHRQAPYEVIVAALCVYCMNKDGRGVRLHGKDHPSFLREIGLAEHEYITIISNLASILERYSLTIHRTLLSTSIFF